MEQGRNHYRIESHVETTADPRAEDLARLAVRDHEGGRTGPYRGGRSGLGDAELVGFKVQGRSDAHVVDEGLFIEDVIVGVRMVITYQVAPTASGGTRVTR